MSRLKQFAPLLENITYLITILTYFGVTSNELINMPPLAMLVFIIVILFYLLRQVKKIKVNYKEILVDKDIEKIQAIKGVDDILKAIPKNMTLEFWLEKVKGRANNWAEDAVLTSFNLYLDYTKGKWKIPTLQTNFYSEWKKETATFYEGAFDSESFYEASHETNPINPFFNEVTDWQLLVTKAFSKVSSRLGSEFEIIIRSSPLNISVNYKEGRLNRRAEFDTKNGKIISSSL